MVCDRQGAAGLVIVAPLDDPPLPAYVEREFFPLGATLVVWLVLSMIFRSARRV